MRYTRFYDIWGYTRFCVIWEVIRYTRFTVYGLYVIRGFASYGDVMLYEALRYIGLYEVLRYMGNVYVIRGFTMCGLYAIRGLRYTWMLCVIRGFELYGELFVIRGIMRYVENVSHSTNGLASVLCRWNMMMLGTNSVSPGARHNYI